MKFGWDKSIFAIPAFFLAGLVSADALHTESQHKTEIWLDAQHRNQEPRNGIDDDYSEQGFVRYTFRQGYTVNKGIDLTPYIRVHGAHSWSDDFPFINKGLIYLSSLHGLILPCSL